MTNIKVEASAPRKPLLSKVSSNGRGKPIADLIAKIEKIAPETLKESRLSSAAMRAGDMVRAMRKEARLSQAQLAEKLGVTQARISEIELGLGPQGPTWEVMERISEACGKKIVLSAA